MKLNLQTVRFAADAIGMLNGARLSVNGLYSIAGVDWLIAAGLNFSYTTALRFATTALKSRRKTWTILDNEGTNRTTCENVLAITSTPISRERNSVHKTGALSRRCSEIWWGEDDSEGRDYLCGV